jgi:hypothetical protein
MNARSLCLATVKMTTILNRWKSARRVAQFSKTNMKVKMRIEKQMQGAVYMLELMLLLSSDLAA